MHCHRNSVWWTPEAPEVTALKAPCSSFDLVHAGLSKMEIINRADTERVGERQHLIRLIFTGVLYA